MTRVAIAGLGTIGRVLARKLADGMPGLTLACAAARDRAKAEAWLEAERIACPLVEPEAFPAHADLAIECAPASVLERICRPMLEAGKTVMVLSAGALLPRPELIELAKAHGGQIIVPTGALLGLEPGLRLGTIARGRAGEREARHAVGKLTGEHAPDGAESGDGDARHGHGASADVETGHSGRSATSQAREPRVKPRLDPHRDRRKGAAKFMEETKCSSG